MAETAPARAFVKGANLVEKDGLPELTLEGFERDGAYVGAEERGERFA